MTARSGLELFDGMDGWARDIGRHCPGEPKRRLECGCATWSEASLGAGRPASKQT
jgi:hypothetical protein